MGSLGLNQKKKRMKQKGRSKWGGWLLRRKISPGQILLLQPKQAQVSSGYLLTFLINSDPFELCNVGRWDHLWLLPSRPRRFSVMRNPLLSKQLMLLLDTIVRKYLFMWSLCLSSYSFCLLFLVLTVLGAFKTNLIHVLHKSPQTFVAMSLLLLSLSLPL